MVADNKQPASNAGITSPVKTGDGGGNDGTRRLPKLGVNKKWLAVIIIIVALLVGWAHFGLHIGEKVYAQAAGHKVYKQDIDTLKNGNQKISDRQAATVLADKYLTEAMAEQQGVKVTNKDIEAAYGPKIEQQRDNNPYTYQNLVNRLYFTKLNAANQGTFQGKLLVANFSRNVPYDSPLLPEKKAANPSLGNPAAIAADKKYAQDFITDLYNQVQKQQITFDQAIQQEHANPTVGQKAYPTQDHSSSFNGPVSQINLLNTDAVKNALVKQKSGTTTQPFVVRVPASIYNDSTAEAYFLVVRLDSRSGGKATVPFPQELAQAKKQLGYKVNV